MIHTAPIGYNYARSGSTAIMPSSIRNTLGFQIGSMAGKAVNLTLNVAGKLWKATTTVGRWLRSNVLRPIMTVYRGTRVLLTKLIRNGKVIGIKIANIAKKAGQGVIRAAKGTGRLIKSGAIEVKNIAKDVGNRFKDIKQDTKDIYNLKKNRYIAKHGKEPSKGTKARYAYDSFVSGRVAAKNDSNTRPMNSKTGRFVQDFKKAANSAVKKVVAETAVRVKDAALIGAGIYGLTQMFDSKEGQ